MELYQTNKPLYYLQNRPRIYKGISVGTKQWVVGAFMYFPKYTPIDPYEVPNITEDDPIPLIIDTTIHESGRPNFIRSNTVYPNTISEFTGFYDKKGTPIWEGDILKYAPGKYHSSDICIVEHAITGFIARIINNIDQTCHQPPFQHSEVIGNIWDNSDIVEENIIVGQEKRQ